MIGRRGDKTTTTAPPPKEVIDAASSPIKQQPEPAAVKTPELPVGGEQELKPSQRLTVESLLGSSEPNPVYRPKYIYNGKALDEIDIDILNKVAKLTKTIQEELVETLDIHEATQLPRDKFLQLIKPHISKYLRQKQIMLNLVEENYLELGILHEMVGLGPLEPLLEDSSISDILVNNAEQTYVERHGTLALTSIKFRDDEHLMNVISRIVSQAGRRVDEKHPYVDTRLPDGSRVNAIIAPLAIDGASISIRKFKSDMISLFHMIDNCSMSEPMAKLLAIAVRSRLNVLVSGGTGSGKTTMLNALSQMIGPDERVVTIEDAAELQLKQPHLVRLETRPANVEGEGEVSMRQLVINSLRMRPDRVILGEIRGPEAFEMLQAMNTGHDGSMCTIHASSPMEVPTRLSNMLMMLGYNFSTQFILSQIASSVNLIVQISRMRDGKRRVVSISEITGIEGENITMDPIFSYKQTGEDKNGHLIGEFEYSGVKPLFMENAVAYGLGEKLEECFK